MRQPMPRFSLYIAVLDCRVLDDAERARSAQLPSSPLELLGLLGITTTCQANCRGLELRLVLLL